MKAVIFSGGSIQFGFALGFVKDLKPDYIVAADRGLEFCKAAELDPDCIVGDFDSINPAVIDYYRTEKNIPIHTFQPEKDMTDTDIAVKRAVEAGADEIYFLGCTGTRLDHVLSSIYNLSLLREQGIKGWIVDDHNLITMPMGQSYEIRKEDQFGKYVSLFPFRNQVEGLTLRGMKYLLTDATLILGDGGLGVSNEIVGETGSMSWKKGILLVIESRD